jgi:signal transduction histidine kinase
LSKDISLIANQTLRFHKQSTKPQSITCLSLFSTTLNLYESRLKNSGIVVEKRKRANEPVACFEGDVRQVLSNVVTNAIDAMPLGGRLLVRSREATEWSTGRKGLALTIADTGSGMDHDTQCRMYEAFFTTKGIGGNGLGLWISADIMNRHQGTIRIRSSQEPASGTVVTLFLPFETVPKVESLSGTSTQTVVA